MDTVFLAVFVVITLGCFPLIWQTFINNWKLRSIPTAGASSYLTSYITALRYFRHGREIVQEGYDKYHGATIFKVPTLKSWIIFASGRHHIDEICRASDDVLSLRQSFRESMSTDVTIGPEHINDPFHVEIVRGSFTRSIGTRYADILDEIVLAFSDNIPAKGNEWVKVTAYETMMDIVCRTTNRMLVGLPLCRDSDWIDLNKNFTIHVVKASFFLGVFPQRFRRYLSPFLRSAPRAIERGAKHLEPLIRERLMQEEEYGEDWQDRPNDVITWVIEAGKGGQRKMRDLTNAVLLINFVSIHTTTMAATHIIFELAARPEYVEPLREEVEAVINEEGWSKDSVRNFWKMDSFIREVVRLSNPGTGSITRKVLKDFTFSDGTTIPAGNIVAVPSYSVHTDPDNYTDPGVFDGFRFEKLRQQEGADLKHQMVTLDLDYIYFGHGRHGCPGRFFAVNELKVILAHVLLNYDVKLVDGHGCPENWTFGENSAPNGSAQVMFRKRDEA